MLKIGLVLQDGSARGSASSPVTVTASFPRPCVGVLTWPDLYQWKATYMTICAFICHSFFFKADWFDASRQ